MVEVEGQCETYAPGNTKSNCEYQCYFIPLCIPTKKGHFGQDETYGNSQISPYCHLVELSELYVFFFKSVKVVKDQESLIRRDETGLEEAWET